MTPAATFSSDASSTAASLPSRFSTLKPDVKILGIESSCDETGAAVVTADGRVLGEALASQVWTRVCQQKRGPSPYTVGRGACVSRRAEIRRNTEERF